MAHNKSEISIERYPAVPFAQDTLERIRRLRGDGDGVLSVYLNIEPSQAQREGFEAALLDLWKPLRAAFTNTDLQDRLEEETGQVNEYVRSWDEPPGRSVVIFSSAPRSLLIPIRLDIPVTPGAWFALRPYLLPLIEALDEYERFCVALVDNERARILTVWLGAIEQAIDFTDVVPGRSAAGGWSQARYARHREYHVHLHMQHVVDELWQLAQRSPFDRLIIGGPPEAMTELKNTLPRSLAQKLAGEFSGEMFATDAAIVEHVRRLEEQAEREKEREVVSELMDRALPMNRAVLGWDGASMALAEGRVHKLVLIHGETSAGSGCAEGHLTVQEHVEQCPYCGEPTWPVSDLAAWLTHSAMTTGASVEFVSGEAAERLHLEVVGALLRY